MGRKTCKIKVHNPHPPNREGGGERKTGEWALVLHPLEEEPLDWNYTESFKGFKSLHQRQTKRNTRQSQSVSFQKKMFLWFLHLLGVLEAGCGCEFFFFKTGCPRSWWASPPPAVDSGCRWGPSWRPGRALAWGSVRRRCRGFLRSSSCPSRFGSPWKHHIHKHNSGQKEGHGVKTTFEYRHVHSALATWSNGQKK